MRPPPSGPDPGIPDERTPRPLRWVYPTPDYPFMQWVWRKLHPRRVRAFEAALRERILDELDRAYRDAGLW